MTTTITKLTVSDIRFPTSRSLDGSDAMNAAPDYSAAYVILETDTPQRLSGHGLTFTIGRGNEVCVAAARSLAPLVVGNTLEKIAADMGAFWRHITSDSQLRWIGPEKGAIHLATAAIVNAVWDLWAKSANKPVWKLLTDLSPEELVRCLDFRFVTDALTPSEALEILRRHAPTRAVREAENEPRLRAYSAERLKSSRSSSQDAAIPISKPQNGAPMFQSVTSLTVTMNVMSAPKVNRSRNDAMNAVWSTRSIASPASVAGAICASSGPSRPSSAPVYALACDTSTEIQRDPSMRSNAKSRPSASTIAVDTVTPNMRQPRKTA